MIEVWIPGAPKGQPRPRAFARGGKARVYDPGTAEGWKGQIALALQDALDTNDRFDPTAPLAVSMRFSMPRPSAMRRKRPHPEDGAVPHVKKPDIDNLIKAVLDACTQLQIWHDDSQVCRLIVSKMYHRDKGGCAGLRLKIEEWSPP